MDSKVWLGICVLLSGCAIEPNGRIVTKLPKLNEDLTIVYPQMNHHYGHTYYGIVIEGITQ